MLVITQTIDGQKKTSPMVARKPVSVTRTVDTQNKKSVVGSSFRTHPGAGKIGDNTVLWQRSDNVPQIFRLYFLLKN
jgi:hypothetical protein